MFLSLFPLCSFPFYLYLYQNQISRHLMNSQFPFSDPVIVFGIVLVIILTVPLLFSRLRIPGIIGLILAGMLIGPSWTNLIASEGSIELLGNVGLMYLMFLAGLELDMQTFSKSSNRSITFGFITFFVPISLGYITCRYLLGFNQLASLLISSMLSAHTLISYPIVSRFKITRIEPIGVTIGGTIITNILVLFLLAVITALAQGKVDTIFWVKLLLFTVLSIASILLFYPIIGKWFFRNMVGEEISQYVFVITMVFLAGILAKLAGIEPIIGAFLAGIVFNRLIPQSSTLMNRVEFIGNALFIPFFLVYVGMLIDIKSFFQGWDSLKNAIVLISVAIITKWIAAFITQKLFFYKTVYRNLIFGLSSSHAAATIAVILIGYQMQIIDINILNATAVLILITCLISSLVTENASRKVVITEKIHPSVAEKQERFLVPLSNPVTANSLIDFTGMIKSHHGRDPIYVLQVVKDENEVSASNQIITKAIENRSSTDNKIEVATRVDMNIAAGIIRACKELMISDIILGWSGRFSPKQWIFGSLMENVLDETRQPVFITGLKHPMTSFNQVSVLIPPVAEFEPGFTHWLRMLKNIVAQTKAKLVFYTPSENYISVKNALDSQKFKIKYTIEMLSSWDGFFTTPNDSDSTNLLFFISARRGSISYNNKLDGIPKNISRRFKNRSFVIVYPSREKVTTIDSRVFLTGAGQMPVEEKETLLSKVK